jgi:hypothetical protein
MRRGVPAGAVLLRDLGAGLGAYSLPNGRRVLVQLRAGARRASDEDRAERRWPFDAERRALLVAYAGGEKMKALAAARGVTGEAVRQTIRGMERLYGIDASPATHAPPALRPPEIDRPLIRFYENHVLNHETGCWDWIGPHGPHGHGQMSMGSRGAGWQYARHFAYETFIGPIPTGYWVSSTCRSAMCVNPDHLFAAPPKEVMGRTRDRRSPGVEGG